MEAIKLEELMIGNYVFFETSRKWKGTIKGFDGKHLIYNVGLGIMPEKYNAKARPIYCKPIPLTEQWLLDFGFESKALKNGVIEYKIGIAYNSGHEDHLSIEDWGFPKDGFPKYVFGVGYNHETKMNFRKIISYVHQLQNLYYSLTNTPLTLNN